MSIAIQPDAVPFAPRPLSTAKQMPRYVITKYLALVLIYAVVFSLWQIEPVPQDVHLLAIVVAATSLIPIMRWYAQGSQGLPMFELICLSYMLQFSTPVYLQPNSVVIRSQSLALSWESVFQTLVYVELGVVALVVGYYVGLHSPLARDLPKIDLPIDPNRRTLYIVSALVAGLLVRMTTLGNIPALGAIVGVISNQFNLAVILLAYQVFGQNKPNIEYRVLLYGSVGIAALWGLTSAQLEGAMIPLVLLVVVRWHASQKIPWSWFIAGFLVFILLNSVKLDIRRQISAGTAQSGWDILPTWAERTSQVVGTIAGEDPLASMENTVLRSMSRLDLLHKFVYVQDMTPGTVPFYQGETYSYFVVGWMPRILWPDKPSASDANDRMDVDYRFLFRFQTAMTKIAIGQLPEAYANFGVAGILIVMALQGILLGILNQVLNSSRSEGGRAIYLSLMVYMLNGIGTSMSIWFGALLQNVLANALVLRPFAVGFQGKHGPQVPSPISSSSTTDAASLQLTTVSELWSSERQS